MGGSPHPFRLLLSLLLKARGQRHVCGRVFGAQSSPRGRHEGGGSSRQLPRSLHSPPRPPRARLYPEAGMRGPAPRPTVPAPSGLSGPSAEEASLPTR